MISVIIPTFNRESKIINSIRSILKYNCFTQIIVIDDKSTDDTLKVLHKFDSHNYPKVNFTFLINTKNLGVSKSRNRAIPYVSNDWYCFLDSDDVFIEFQESVFIQYFNRYSDSAFLFFSCVNKMGKSVGKIITEPKCIDQKYFLNKGTGGEKILFVNKRVCKDFLFDKKIDGFEKLTIGRFMKDNKAQIIPYKIRLYEVYYDSMSHKNSLTAKRLNNLIEGHMAFVQEFTRELSYTNLFKTYLKIIYYKLYTFLKFKL